MKCKDCGSARVEFDLQPMPIVEFDGPTLRDQFAMGALAAMVGHQQAHNDAKRAGWDSKTFKDETAKAAYEYADAMLDARAGKVGAK